MKISKADKKKLIELIESEYRHLRAKIKNNLDQKELTAFDSSFGMIIKVISMLRKYEDLRNIINLLNGIYRYIWYNEITDSLKKIIGDKDNILNEVEKRGIARDKAMAMINNMIKTFRENTEIKNSIEKLINSLTEIVNHENYETQY